jgi:hypothetical protein
MKTLFNKLFRNLPFRIALGKLGIRLIAWGRWLQVRYANWNSEFRLQVVLDECKAEYHVSHEVLKDSYTLSFPSIQNLKVVSDDLREMVEQLLKINGVQNVHLMRYRVLIFKAKVFEWNELCSQVEEVLLTFLTDERKTA